MPAPDVPFTLPEDMSGYLAGGATFTPPTVEEGIETNNPLFRYYKIRRGVTVLVTGATARAVQYPTQDDLDAADAVYMGGHVYPVEPLAAAILVAAGLGAYLS